MVIAIRRMSGHVQCEGDRWWLNGRPCKSYSRPAKAGAIAVRKFLAAKHPEFRREIVRTIVVFTNRRSELHLREPEVAVVRGADLLGEHRGARPRAKDGPRSGPRGRPPSGRRRPRAVQLVPAISTKRQSALISRICSIVRARDSSRRGLATMQARHIARETATLRRLREKRNSRLRGTSSALDVAIE